MLNRIWTTSIMIAATACTFSAVAQQTTPATASPPSGIKRTPLQRFAVPGTTYETVIGLADIAPDVSIGRHTHPGPESGYIMAGGFDLMIDGQPVRTLKAGDSYVVPEHTVHDAKSGREGARVIATYVIPKGRPLASPAK
ncbi:MAG: cupin domain-containing protein [Burkholderiaceae bacterium]